MPAAWARPASALLAPAVALALLEGGLLEGGLLESAGATVVAT